MKTKFKQFIIYLSMPILLLTILAIFVKTNNIRINLTESYPVGLYKTDTHPSPKKKDLVVVCPPNTQAFKINNKEFIQPGKECGTGTISLIKKIAATAGDVVEVNKSGVWINGQKQTKSKVYIFSPNMKKLHPCYGKHIISKNCVWIMSDYDDRSFDSRYFCEVPAANIIAKAKLLLEF